MKRWISRVLIVAIAATVLPLAGCKNGGSANFNKPDRPTPYPSSWHDRHINGRD